MWSEIQKKCQTPEIVKHMITKSANIIMNVSGSDSNNHDDEENDRQVPNNKEKSTKTERHIGSGKQTDQTNHSLQTHLAHRHTHHTKASLLLLSSRCISSQAG